MTSASASHTIRLATSPLLCPPRPSATPQMPTSVRSMNESWLISRTQPGSLAAADRKRGGDGSSTSVSGSATVSTLRRDRPPPSLGPRAVEQRRERVGMRKALHDQTARLDSSTIRRSTTAPSARRSPTGGRVSICSNVAPSSFAAAIGICQPAAASVERRGRRTRARRPAAGAPTRAVLPAASTALRSARSRRGRSRASRRPGARRRRRTTRLAGRC